MQGTLLGGWLDGSVLGLRTLAGLEICFGVAMAFRLVPPRALLAAGCAALAGGIAYGAAAFGATELPPCGCLGPLEGGSQDTAASTALRLGVVALSLLVLARVPPAGP